MKSNQSEIVHTECLYFSDGTVAKLDFRFSSEAITKIRGILEEYNQSRQSRQSIVELSLNENTKVKLPNSLVLCHITFLKELMMHRHLLYQNLNGIF